MMKKLLRGSGTAFAKASCPGWNDASGDYAVPVMTNGQWPPVGRLDDLVHQPGRAALVSAARA